jgi:hypothetical protein
MPVSTTRTFAEDGTRYEIDNGVCNTDNGFCQVDTDQDASYFGIWTSPERRVVCSFMEGDITVNKATTDAEYREVLVNCLTAYKHRNEARPHAMIDLGISRRDEFRDAFVTLGMASYIY